MKRKFLYIVCAGIIIIISYMVVLQQMQVTSSDVALHTHWAQGIKDIKSMFQISSYPLYHLSVFGVWKLWPLSIRYCAAIVISGCNLVTYCFLNRYFETSIKKEEKKNVLPLIVLILMVVQAIYIPWFNENIYLGQGSINIWHNPTYIIVKPISIAIFALVCKLYLQNKKIVLSKAWWLLVVLNMVANLAKPSFFYVFVPGLGIFMLLDVLFSKGKRLSLHFQMASSFFPAALLALFQLSSSLTTGIEWEWLGVWRNYSKNPGISILLFMAFPLYVYALNIKDFADDDRISLSVFGVGVLEAALLAEEGYRRNNGNFFWCYYLGGLLMWLVSMKRFICWHRTSNSGREWLKIYIGWGLLLLHTCAGIYYIYLLLTVPGFLN